MSCAKKLRLNRPQSSVSSAPTIESMSLINQLITGGPHILPSNGFLISGALREMGTRIFHRRWDQDEKWQVMRCNFFEALYRWHETYACFSFFFTLQMTWEYAFLGVSDYSHVTCRYYSEKYHKAKWHCASAPQNQIVHCVVLNLLPTFWWKERYRFDGRIVGCFCLMGALTLGKGFFW